MENQKYPKVMLTNPNTSNVFKHLQTYWHRPSTNQSPVRAWHRSPRGGRSRHAASCCWLPRSVAPAVGSSDPLRTPRRFVGKFGCRKQIKNNVVFQWVLVPLRSTTRVDLRSSKLVWTCSYFTICSFLSTHPPCGSWHVSRFLTISDVWHKSWEKVCTTEI